MEKIARQISFDRRLPRELWRERLVYYSEIYLKIRQKKIKKSFKLINQRRSKLIWNVDYNRNTKFYTYKLYLKDNNWIDTPNKLTSVVANYNEDVYRLEDINFTHYFTRLFVDIFGR